MAQKLYILALLVALLVALLAPSTLVGRNRLCTIGELNKTPHTLNSHAGVERYSSLEAEQTTYRIIPREELDIKSRPTYSRIKRMSNGEWLLLFQGAQIGSYIYYSISSDLAPINISTKRCQSRIEGIVSRCRKGVTDNGERGFIAEVAIPRALILGNEIALHATLSSNDKSDTFSHAREEDTSTRPRIVLKQ